MLHEHLRAAVWLEGRWCSLVVAWWSVMVAWWVVAWCVMAGDGGMVAWLVVTWLAVVVTRRSVVVWSAVVASLPTSAHAQTEPNALSQSKLALNDFGSWRRAAMFHCLLRGA